MVLPSVLLLLQYGLSFFSRFLYSFLSFPLYLLHDPKPNDAYFEGFWQQKATFGIISMLISNCDINDEFDKPHTQTQISEAQTTSVYFLANSPMGWLKQHYFRSWGAWF